MRRIKTYLKTAMTPRQLNNAMVLNNHKEALENISIIDIVIQFFRGNNSQMNSIGTLSDSNIIGQHSIKKVAMKKVSVATQT